MNEGAEHRLGGSCLTVGDDVNTDIVIPGRYLVSIDPEELAKHAFEPMGSAFQERLYEADVLVTGGNFGCGSAREQAATCLQGAGIVAVVGQSFDRAFFRNAINNGLLAVEAPEAVALASDGDSIWVDYEAGNVEVGDEVVPFEPYPPIVNRILEAGGLIPYVAAGLGTVEGGR